MAPVLLTAEQARRNLEVFQYEGSKQIKGKREEDLPLETSIGEAISRASALNLPEHTSPPPSNVETFRNPKHHGDVLSTFLATAMASVGYIPNATGDAAKEAKGFGDLLSALLGFGSYMPLLSSAKREFSYDGKGDCCKALLEEIESFVGESGIEDPTIVIRQLLIQASSLTSTQETQTMFVGYHFEGAESNPALYIFYGIAKMLRTDLGKSMATANQSIVVRYYKYEIISKLVSSMAEALAITVVPAETLIKTINARFLLPTN